MSGRWNRTEARIRRLAAAGRVGRVCRALHAALLEERPSSDGDELDLLYHATSLAAQYDRPRTALRWLRSHRLRRQGKAPLDPPLERAYEVLELNVHWIVKNERGARRILERLDWNEVPALSWAYHLRLAHAARRNREDEVLDLLRRPSPAIVTYPDLRDPHERGNRLRILGLFFFQRGEVPRSAGYARAALRAYRQDRTISSRLREIEVHGLLGRVALAGGDLTECERSLRRAMGLAARLRHRQWYNAFRLDFAYTLSEWGLYARAERHARAVARSSRARLGGATGGIYRHQLLRSVIACGHFAADQGDRSRAARYAASATRLFSSCPDRRFRGYLHLLRGRVRALGKTEAARARAETEFARAADCFGRLGSGDVIGRYRLLIYRADLRLKRRDVRGVLGEAIACMDLAREHRFLPAKGGALLLKSQLLLQEEVPCADRLYEEVLRDLGSARNPVVLFRVIANLYLHSWDLGAQLDLTKRHMEQIHRLRSLLDPRTFHRLYSRHVMQPVARRMLEKTLGIDPSDLRA